jgi:hypothetical protein
MEYAAYAVGLGQAICAFRSFRGRKSVTARATGAEIGFAGKDPTTIVWTPSSISILSASTVENRISGASTILDHANRARVYLTTTIDFSFFGKNDWVHAFI